MFQNDDKSAFAPHVHLFQANAAALSLRLRRPDDFMHTEGSSCLAGCGGKARAAGNQISLHNCTLTADSYHTEVTGDFVDLAAAKKLTESHGDSVSLWGSKELESITTVECKVTGIQSINFDTEARTSGKSLKIGQLDFKMEGLKRQDAMEFRFNHLSFTDISINGSALRISTREDVFDRFGTFAAFKEEFNGNSGFRKEISHMVAHPSTKTGLCDQDELYDRRGYCFVTVVNQIEWVDPKGREQGTINGHTVIVPGYGTIYFGEMTMSPIQRRLHMVRVELGCPDGGSMLMASGCEGYHDLP